MPDRELTDEEFVALKNEYELVRKNQGNLTLDALNILRRQETKPSLHDLCLMELSGDVKAMFLGLEILRRELKAK